VNDTIEYLLLSLNAFCSDTRNELEGKPLDHIGSQSGAVGRNLIHVFLQVHIKEFKHQVELKSR
jgi:hypothetical protein